MHNEVNNYKFVALINKKLETGKAMNALAHMSAGLVAKVTDEDRKKMNFLDFFDKNGNSHPSISALSLIVLRGTSGNIRTLRDKARNLEITHIDFCHTMTEDTFKEQLLRTKETFEANLEYYGVMLFGKVDELNPITRKYSLWR